MVSSGGLVDDNGPGFTDTMFGHEFFYDNLSPHRMVTMIEEIGFDIILGRLSISRLVAVTKEGGRPSHREDLRLRTH
jgi:hypothetical protein